MQDTPERCAKATSTTCIVVHTCSTHTGLATAVNIQTNGCVAYLYNIQSWRKLRARRGKRICDPRSHRRWLRGSRAHVPHRMLHFAQCGQNKWVLMALDMAIAVVAHSSSNINFVDCDYKIFSCPEES